ncbi:MAG: UDP-2,3-diacylglucosamine diphosphatase [Pseudohongiellaceae bacterium]|nr:UDP-2,3-diacylglucosamine diphosphatase [Pseudohongiellaceae bacterium]
MPENPKTLFISDLHLDKEDSIITKSFMQFLSSRARGCKALYILGDLFEVWVGDDDETPLTAKVAEALSELSASGTDIFIMHGNRDFLIGDEYAKRCGASLISEPTLIDCHGHRVVLIHGDHLCTRDTDYMQFRAMVRSEQWQDEFLSKSLVERYMIAQQARQQSNEHNSHKASDIMDVTPSEVTKLLQKQQVNYLIHGHTHRPSVHTIRLPEPINGKNEAYRLVLGSWDDKGWVIEFNDEGFDLKHFAHCSA